MGMGGKAIPKSDKVREQAAQNRQAIAGRVFNFWKL
jgi:hypothetical protein